MQMWRSSPHIPPPPTSSRVASKTPSRKVRTTRLISEGSRSENTRSKVSCDGLSASGPRNMRAISSFSRLLQKASIA